LIDVHVDELAIGLEDPKRFFDTLIGKYCFNDFK